ncbi:alcohol dehydrogenase [Amycolatopsis thermophila]|uniref:Alcohol dehydrogenase/propanol-preferring alcohol dehydrogenase n=1 Tax=Amycolatopsis thermophila TaxID=206084 RepID=A0ABU0F169_9PSEU|nr:alcohol dehydrogenase [Amycolatopsis thermophila]MDQ0381319.1 alcohol dehydrogenase/propanol-preferring alcohol dehydrogenase [Amycolatopsis thermophila]
MVDVELPTPSPTGREVLLKVERSGVCHTDTHLRHGSYDLGARGSLRLVDRGVSYPLVMGHEVVGTVVAVGDQVSAHHPGDLRLVYPWIGCGDCAECDGQRDNYCAAGRNLGVARHGGYAEYVLVPDEKYLEDITGLDPSWAATLACSGLTAFSAVHKVLPLRPAEPVVVIGAGGVGLTAIAVLRALGHDDICAVDLSAENVAVARGLGASASVRATGDEVSKDIVEACHGPVAAVIDFVNSGVTATAAFDALRKGGRLVQVGLFGGELTVPTALMALKMLTIRGSFVGTPEELRSLVALARRGALPHIPVIDAPLDARSVQDALNRLTRGGVPGRIVLRAADA